ncbi:MAG TPA: IS91 family transposase [Bacteroidales bacterium]|nr:IS91 family transposase [Bacteroidales bacterium]
MKARHTVQEILRQTPFNENFNPFSERVLNQLCQCRSAALGYHHYHCSDSNCRHVHYQYHSCHNRHCPSCNWQRHDEWQEARMNELLPVKYFHTVFTLPHKLNPLVMGNRTVLFKLLFDSAAYCLLKLCNDPKWLGAMPSITSVLHTWGQQLCFHPHVHCIVSGGGADKNYRWHNLKKSVKYGYLFPYDVMEAVFKGYFLEKLNVMVKTKQVSLPENTHWPKLKDGLYKQKWIVYAKQPMGNVSQVVEYLARYAHKVAISNYRILDVSDTQVRFRYKDYNDGKKSKTMRLSKEEFVRRFEQHILPRGFVKMRHYGLLGNFKRKERINKVLDVMGLPQHPPNVKIPFYIRFLEKFGVDIMLCPACKKAKLQLVGVVFPSIRGSPKTTHNDVL